jgi:hypothetical protein
MRLAAFALLAACSSGGGGDGAGSGSGGAPAGDVTRSFTIDGVTVKLTHPSTWTLLQVDKRTGAPVLVPPDAKNLKGVPFDRVTLVTWSCDGKPDGKTCLADWITTLSAKSNPVIEELGPEKRWVVSKFASMKAQDARLFVYLPAANKVLGCVGMLTEEHASWLPAIRKVCDSMTAAP